MPKRALAAALVLGGVVTGVAAGYAAHSYVDYRLGATFAWASFQDRAATLRFDVEALQSLRRGDAPSVITALETRVDLGLASVSRYHDLVPASIRSQSFYDDIAAVRAYRQNFPGPLASGPIGDAARRALELRPSDEAPPK